MDPVPAVSLDLSGFFGLSGDRVHLPDLKIFLSSFTALSHTFARGSKAYRTKTSTRRYERDDLKGDVMNIWWMVAQAWERREMSDELQFVELSLARITTN